MNTIMLRPDQFISERRARLSPRQADHLAKVLRAQEGDRLKLGVINGKLGRGIVSQDSQGYCLNEISLDTVPPPQLPLTLVLALPRPQMLKRILQSVACFGVEQLVFIHSQRVEKSFWQSPSLKHAEVQRQLLLGVEQANATQLPEIVFFKSFKPFIEDHCPSLSENSEKILLHPGSEMILSSSNAGETGFDRTTLAIGPEGGFTDYECDRFAEIGFAKAHLGQRVLKVETAVVAALSRFIA